MEGSIPGEKHDGPSRAAQMEAIVAEHETALLRYAARIVNSPVAAQDVVQTVFIKLFSAWKQGTRPSAGLKAWLYRVTHNEAVDHVRRESRLEVLHRKHAEQTGQSCPDGNNCPAALDDRKQMVLEHLRRLHPREQQVVLLRLQEGLSYKEIGEVLGRTQGNVGSILHHAVQKLAARLRKGNREMR